MGKIYIHIFETGMFNFIRYRNIYFLFDKTGFANNAETVFYNKILLPVQIERT